MQNYGVCYLIKHNDIIIAELSVIPACLESFSEEGCWTSQHDREVALCDIN